MQHARPIWLAFTTGLVLAAPSAAVTLLDLDRFVQSGSVANLDPEASVEDQALESSRDAGRFLEAAVTAASLALIAESRAEALQDSSVLQSAGGAVLADGSGSVAAAVDVADPGFATRASADAASSTEIVFELTDAREYALAVSIVADLVDLSVVSGAATAAADLLVRFSLVGAAAGVVAAGSLIDDAPGGAPLQEDFAFAGVLAPDVYSLLLESSLVLSATEDAFARGGAGYGFDLRIVPEPGSAPLVLLGLALLTRRSGCRYLQAKTGCS